MLLSCYTPTIPANIDKGQEISLYNIAIFVFNLTLSLKDVKVSVRAMALGTDVFGQFDILLDLLFFSLFLSYSQNKKAYFFSGVAFCSFWILQI